MPTQAFSSVSQLPFETTYSTTACEQYQNHTTICVVMQGWGAAPDQFDQAPPSGAEWGSANNVIPSAQAMSPAQPAGTLVSALHCHVMDCHCCLHGSGATLVLAADVHQSCMQCGLLRLCKLFAHLNLAS